MSSLVLPRRYHAWVNADALLAKCLVGYLAPGLQQQQQRSSSGGDSSAAASPSLSPGPSTASSEGEAEEDGRANPLQQQWSGRQLAAA